MSLSNNPVEEIKELLRSGALTDASYARLKSEIDAEKAAQNQKREAAREQHRLEQEIKNKPENKFPQLWNLRKVYPQDLDQYCLTYNLQALQTYAEGLQTGACQSDDFKDGSGFAAFGYLNGKIAERKINLKSGESGHVKAQAAR